MIAKIFSKINLVLITIVHLAAMLYHRYKMQQIEHVDRAAKQFIGNSIMHKNKNELTRAIDESIQRKADKKDVAHIVGEYYIRDTGIDRGEVALKQQNYKNSRKIMLLLASVSYVLQLLSGTSIVWLGIKSILTGLIVITERVRMMPQQVNRAVLTMVSPTWYMAIVNLAAMFGNDIVEVLGDTVNFIITMIVIYQNVVG